ncbi:uncharacterized protein EAF01_001811 [Botrytis porri]|uniref:uncharacterized protein n=1 Tax=Botrytis porri TaxID=87229 RepID=UPI0018FFC5DE|nr:uncharacterized protein EAF01_001811 [Botrytis porri]KAF7912790.1 hypothetical protein EAF01_001811 [Botrytis porri]
MDFGENSKEKNKIKVLCLHGIGTNAEVLEAQTAALRYELGNDYEYDFLEGGYPWPVAPEIGKIFGDQQIYRSYFDESGDSLKDALDDLDQYVTNNGPFHIVMGFSLGAAFAATLLLRDEMRRSKSEANHYHILAKAKPRFKCAIFICGTLPPDLDALEHGDIQALRAKDFHSVITVPTVHLWSTRDVDHATQSKELVRMCEERSRVEILHAGGHSVPHQGDELKAVAAAVHEFINRNA